MFGMRKTLIVPLAALGVFYAGIALADLDVKDAAGTTRKIFNFVCQTTKLCNATVLIKSDGTEIGTSSTPVRTDPTGSTTQPVSGTVTANVGTGTRPVSAAPGSYSSGAFATGAGVDGWDVTQGATADAAATAGGTGSHSAKLRLMTSQQATTNNSIGATSEAAAGSDTATSGLNGLIKRMLQSITSLNGKIDTLNTTATSPVPCLNATTSTTNSYSNGGTNPANCDLNGNLYVNAKIASGQTITANNAAADPCQTTANSGATINISSATTTRIIAPSASNRTYICSIDILAFAANNVAIVEGTGGTCGTGTAGVVGGTTTGAGVSFPAQAGLVKGGAGTWVWRTAGTNVDFCLITSTTGPLTGYVKYVQAP